MLKIITGTPLYVWPLLAYVIFIGIKASKKNVIPLNVLLIAPALFATWYFYSIIKRYGAKFFVLSIALSSMFIGIFVGCLVMHQTKMRFDKIKKYVELPGSWITFVLLMSLFSIKYFLGVTNALMPELARSWILLMPEFLAIMLAGVLLGRVVSCWQKYQKSTHVDLD